MSPRVPFPIVALFALCIAVFAPIACGGCKGPPPEPPHVVVPAFDGGYLDTPCGRACKRLNELGCPESMPNAAGRRCETTCEEAIADGLLPSGHPDCILRAKTKDEARACRVRCGAR